MDQEFKARYVERGRQLTLLGSPVGRMEKEDLYAVIGYLHSQCEHGDVEAGLRQEAPLGSAQADPPKNDGLIEG